MLVSRGGRRLVERWFVMRCLLSLVILLAACQQDCANVKRDGCCKVCKTGKPCGDTCISEQDTCRTVGGCACGR
jgi:hypothetical protein